MSSSSVIDLGGVTITRLVEAEEPLLKPAEIFPDSTPEIIEKNLDWLVPQFYDPQSDRLIISIQSFIVETKDKIIVVDTCVGDCKPRIRHDFDRKQWNWLDKLIALGIDPESVDVALSTHMHVDHVGWHTRLVDGEWKPTFPNARYLFTKPEWDYWKDNEGHPSLARSGDYIGDSIWPLFHAGLADVVDMNYRITDEIKLVPFPGHTPGHVGVAVTGAAKEALLSADLFHHPLQCAYPDWNTRFCLNQDQSRATRMAAMEELADKGTLLMPAHFPAPNAGRLERIAKGECPDHPEHVYRFRFVPFE